MFGSPTPTKQLCTPPSRRALAAIIISDFENPSSPTVTRTACSVASGPPEALAERSRVPPIVDLAGERFSGTQGVPVGVAPLLDVLGVVLEAVDPFLQPRLERLRVARDRVPLE